MNCSCLTGLALVGTSSYLDLHIYIAAYKLRPYIINHLFTITHLHCNFSIKNNLTAVDYLPLNNKKLKLLFFHFLKKRKQWIYFFCIWKETLGREIQLLIPHKFPISFSIFFQMSSAIREIIQNVLAIVWHVKKKRKNTKKKCLM